MSVENYPALSDFKPPLANQRFLFLLWGLSGTAGRGWLKFATPLLVSAPKLSRNSLTKKSDCS